MIITHAQESDRGIENRRVPWAGRWLRYELCDCGFHGRTWDLVQLTGQTVGCHFLPPPKKKKKQKQKHVGPNSPYITRVRV